MIKENCEARENSMGCKVNAESRENRLSDSLNILFPI